MARIAGTVEAADLVQKTRTILTGYHVDKIEADAVFSFYNSDGTQQLADLTPLFTISGSGFSYLTGLNIPFDKGLTVSRTTGNVARMIVYYG